MTPGSAPLSTYPTAPALSASNTTAGWSKTVSTKTAVPGKRRRTSDVAEIPSIDSPS